MCQVLFVHDFGMPFLAAIDESVLQVSAQTRISFL